MLDVDESGRAAQLLGLGHDMKRQRRFAGAFGAIDLDDAAAGNAADAQRDIERQRAGRNAFDIHRFILPQAHDAALAIAFFDLLERQLKRLFLVSGQRLFIFLGRRHCLVPPCFHWIFGSYR